MPDNYVRNRDAEQERSFNVNASKDLPRWRSVEDVERIKKYDMYEKLFEGNHYRGDGGPFNHPYGKKGEDESILYQQLNILGKSTEKYSDLIVGDGISLNSENSEIQEILDEIDFDLSMHEAISFASVFGFCGLQPTSCKEWMIIRPHNLYIEYNRSCPNNVEKIRKAIVFKDVQVGNQKWEILYEETHFPGVIETRLFQVQGEFVLQELDLPFFNEFVDPSTILVELTHLPHNNFGITLLFNNKFNGKIRNDYTKSAINAQESVNRSMTRIDRILTAHSDPKVMVPQSLLTQDTETGQWYFDMVGTEVIPIPLNVSNPIAYATWNGELGQAVNQRNFQIMSVFADLDMAPHLFPFIELVGGTVAETSAKLEKMMSSTTARAKKKRKRARESIQDLAANMIVIGGVSIEEAYNFSIEFPEIIQQSREEIVEEMVLRKQNGLASTKKALVKMDNLTEEEAEQEATEIHNEAVSDVVNPFQTGFGSPALSSVLEENEEIEEIGVA